MATAERVWSVWVSGPGVSWQPFEVRAANWQDAANQARAGVAAMMHEASPEDFRVTAVKPHAT